MLAVWAEMNVVLADEFRDGNVPAMMAPLAVAKQAYAALPETVTEYYYRGDSASHDSHLINWLRNEEREGGPQGFIGFGISARMSAALHQAILKIPEVPANCTFGGKDLSTLYVTARTSLYAIKTKQTGHLFALPPLTPRTGE